MFFWIVQFILVSSLSSIVINGRHFATKTNKRCMPSFDVAWKREIGTSPIVAPPVITDVDADGNLDIIAVTFSGDVHVVQAKDGRPLTGTNWPYRLLQSTVHATPIQHDYDKDGMLDVLIVTSQGVIHVVSWKGNFITRYQIEKLFVQRDWYKEIITAEENNIHDYILDTPTGDANYVGVDVHVLASPVLVDLDNDGVTEELVIPVSYYYDLEYYSNPELFAELQNGLTYPDLELYLASSVVILNVTSLTPIRTIHMELTKVHAEYPGYQLFSPTVIDIDSSGGVREIVCGSSAGHLHVFNMEGTDREGFPIPTDSLQGQITVEDVNQDGRLDLISSDVSGNVACYSSSGSLQWETQTSGNQPSGTRVAGLHGDSSLQVILATDDGYVWVLDGRTGEVVDDWPFKIKGKLLGVPLITKLQAVYKPVIVVLDTSGFLQILGQDRCRRAVSIRETSLAPVLTHDLIPSSPGLELLLATDDGMIMVVAQGNETGVLTDDDLEDIQFYAWPSEVKNDNNFAFAMYDIAVELPDYEEKITTSSFSLAVTVLDGHSSKAHKYSYTLQVYVGGIHLYTTQLQTPNTVHDLTIPSPPLPLRGHLVVTCTNLDGRIARQVLPVSFYQSLSTDLQWLLLAPTICMGLILLFLYGFPADVLLPSFHQKDV